MHISDFNRKDVDLLIEIKQKKVITSATQTIYGGFGFYGASKFLLKYGLIENSGTNSSRQKIYVLTEKGLELANLMEKILKLIK